MRISPKNIFALLRLFCDRILSCTTRVTSLINTKILRKTLWIFMWNIYAQSFMKLIIRQESPPAWTQQAYRPQEGARCWTPPLTDSPPSWTWPPPAGWIWPPTPRLDWPDPPRQLDLTPPTRQLDLTPPLAAGPDLTPLLAGPDPPRWLDLTPPWLDWPDPPPWQLDLTPPPAAGPYPPPPSWTDLNPPSGWTDLTPPPPTGLTWQSQQSLSLPLTLTRVSLSVEDPGLTGRGWVPTEYLIWPFFLKTKRKWRSFGPEGGTRVPRVPRSANLVFHNKHFCQVCQIWPI